MAGWIVVSFLGALAALMFLAANHQPRPAHVPSRAEALREAVRAARAALAAAAPVLSSSRRQVAG